jgi:hypothetical protein
MTIRELLKDIYDMMMKAKEIAEATLDGLSAQDEAIEIATRYEAAEEMLRQVFKGLHEQGILDVDMALIRVLRMGNENIHADRKSD